MNSPQRIIQLWYHTADPQLLHPNVRWQVLPTFPGGGTYMGRQAVLQQFFPAVRQRYAQYQAIPASYWVVGRTVLVHGHYQGQTHAGQAFRAQFVHIWQTEGGCISALDQVADTASMP